MYEPGVFGGCNGSIIQSHSLAVTSIKPILLGLQQLEFVSEIRIRV